MKAFGSTITTKWEAYEFLQRLLLSRGYGESRALAVIEECERKSMDAHLQTPTDLMHMVNEAVTPFGGPIEVTKVEQQQQQQQQQSPPVVVQPITVAPAPTITTGPTIDEAYTAFIKLKTGAGGTWKQSTENTHRANQRKINVLGLGAIPVAALTRMDLEDARNEMVEVEGMKAGPVNNVFRYLRQAIQDVDIAYGADNGYNWSRPRQVLSDFKAMKDDAAKVARHWTGEAVTNAESAMLSGMVEEQSERSTGIRQSLRVGALWHFRLALATGARKAELEELRVKDVLYDEVADKWALHIRGTKTDAAWRYIPLVDGLLGFPLGEFIEYYKSLPKDDPEGFVIHGRSVTGLTQDERNKWKLEDGTGLTIHGLRHTWATNVTAMGLDNKAFDAIMGHGGDDGRALQKRYSTGATELIRKEWLTLHDKLTAVMTGKPTFMV